MEWYRDSGIDQGKPLIDATCTPANIAFPKDLRLLNEAREQLEGIIDTLHQALSGRTVNNAHLLKESTQGLFVSR